MPAYADNYLDITSTNAIITLACPGVLPNPIQLQNFSADQMAAIDETTIAEARMGVDGGMAAGFIPSPVNLTLTLEANSPSTPYLSSIFTACRANRTTYNCTVTIDLKTTGKRYIFSNGALTGGVYMSSLKKMMEPTTWKFTFARYQESAL